MMDENAAQIVAITALYQIRMQGMIAENQRRAQEGYSQAYGEHSFACLREDLETKLSRYFDVS
jgi:hypothetical protein